MPLKVKAIIDAIKGTPLCGGYLVSEDKKSRERKSMYCVVGALLRDVGATDSQIAEIRDDNSSGDGPIYWNAPTFQKFKPQLKKKFGISCGKHISDLVGLNDNFLVSGYRVDSLAPHKDRTCHVMKTLVTKPWTRKTGFEEN